MIHPQAETGETVTIGAGSRVWQFASVIRGAVLGEDCNVGGCAVVDGARIGNRCCIGHGAQVHPGSKLGDDVFIGPTAVICNDRWPRVGKAGFDIDALVSGRVVSVEIGDGASIGAGAVVLPGVTIGAGAMVAAGATVDLNVPAYHLFKRDGSMVPIDPARPAKRMRQAA